MEITGVHEADNELDGIAVIGMSGRFPGADDLATFWSNLREGVESVRRFTEEELLAAGESEEVLRDPSYVRVGAPLTDIDKFDAAFFGMSPRDAAVFDPQHRIFLECAWQAFEDAGYVGANIGGSVSVFASCGLSDYMFENVLANRQVRASVGDWLIRHTGNDTNFLATRTSYELDLKGPSMNVQTACSSSLVAIHLACQSLLNGESDVALAGGVVISPRQSRGYFYKEGEILSPDGHCRAFDADSAGTIASNAAGCVVLKPLDAAIADGDTVHAVIRGSAINNDGRAKVGYLAPSVEGQARVISEALAVAGVHARDVSYVEMHGTGTLIGDPIEVAGITEAFRHQTDAVQFCAIGSVKPNIGHAGEASGIASFIKTVLALEHGEIPPSLHFRTPNPQVDFPSTPFFVNDHLRRWDVEPGHARIAGITGLGAGGTNVHVVVQEPPAAPVSDPMRHEQLIVLSARSAQSVGRATGELARHLRSHPDVSLADVAFTLMAGRAAFRHRRAVVAVNASEAAAALESADPTALLTGDHGGAAPSVVFMVPGGGAQYAGMGRGLHGSEPAFATAMDRCLAHLRRRHGINLTRLLLTPDPSGASDRELQRPTFALPALFTVEYATAKMLQSWGIEPAAMIGHSAGEYVVACISGVITMEQGLDLVATRGRLFETLPTGRMLSVSLDEQDMRARLPIGLSVAAVNAPGLCVVSGPDLLIAAMEAELTADDVDSMRIPIDVAAHSSMLDPILDEFRTFCGTIEFRSPGTPYVSNLTGTWVSAADVIDPEYWVEHLRRTVRFADGLATILTADPNRVLVEIGPGRTLTGLARLSPQRAVAATPTLRHAKEDVSDLGFALSAVGRMWCAGVELDPASFFAAEARRRVPLPTYSFDRQSYWIDADPVSSTSRSRSSALRKIDDVGAWFSTPTWRRSVTPPPTDEATTQFSWLVVSDGSPLAERIRIALRASGQFVAGVKFGSGYVARSPDSYVVEPSRPQDWIELVSTLGATNRLPDRIVHVSAVGPSRGRRLLGLGTDEIEAFHATVHRDHVSLLLLAQALSSRSAPMRLAVVTSGVHEVAGQRALDSERALLHGTARVIPRELGTTTSITIDLDPALATGSAGLPAVAERIIRELGSEPTDAVAVYRGAERWTRTFEPIALPAPTRSPWRSGATYMITGGLGGIGLSIAEHIADNAREVTLVLVGRSPFPAEQQWDGLLAGKSTRKRQRRQIESIRRIQSAGATVTISSADVTDLEAMRSVVAAVEASGGRIMGVVHAAGVLQDELIALRSPIAMSPVVAVKAMGVLVLDRLLAKHPPEFVVLCSSVSSLIGLPGQADYTAANAFLDAHAARRHAAGGPRYISINWSAWQEVGMAVDAVDAVGAQTPTATRAVEPARARLSNS